MGRVPLLIPLAALVAIILIGDSFGLRRPQEPPEFGNIMCSAYLLSVSEANSDGYLSVAEVDSVNNRRVKVFKARLQILGESFEPIAGERLKFKARVMPLTPKLPIPDAVDLQADLRRRGVSASAVVASGSILYHAPTHSLRYYCSLIRNAALHRLMRTGLNDETVNILAAILLGQSDMLTNPTRELYSAAGLSHILALSGMHVAIITMIFSVALWPLYFGRHVKTRLTITIVALIAYAAMTGFIPSVTRAVIMAAVYMFGRIIQRKSPPLNSLCLAAILILVINPSDLYSAGFQMSFAAVLGIIIFFPLLDRVDRRRHPLLYIAVSYPALSIGAMILTGIVSASHFHTFPVYFLPANLMIIPLVPLAIVSGVISIVFQVPFLSGYFINAIDSVANFWSNIPGAMVANLYPTELEVIFLMVSVTLLGLALGSKNRFWIYESLIVLTGITTIIAVRPRPVYPASETYYVKSPRYDLNISVNDGQCTVLTNAKTNSDLETIIDLYTIVLRDFMAKRNVKTLIVTNGNEQRLRDF